MSLSLRTAIPIFVPIELSAREFDAKLLLAAHLAEKDVRVFLGETKSIFRLAGHATNGIYLGKQTIVGGAAPNVRKYQALQRRGHKLIFQAEEELALDASKVDKAQLLMMFDPRWISPEDYICAWGEFTADLFRGVAPEHAPHIFATGHPKFDLCKPDCSPYFADETQDIKRRFGDFILLNTKFALASNFEALVSAIKDFSDDKPADFWLGYFKYHSALQSAYISLAARLSNELSGTNIVLRPHPGENPAAYHAVLRGYPNVHVLTEGSVLPWLSAAKAVVHTGCTTALEATHLTPLIINYQPVYDEIYDEPTPRIVSMQCESEDQVVELLKSGRTQDKSSLELSQITHQIDNFPLERSASAQMAAIVRSVKTSLGTSSIAAGAFAAITFRNWLESLKKGGQATGKTPKKFTPFEMTEVRRRLDACGKIVAKKLKARSFGGRLLEINVE